MVVKTEGMKHYEDQDLILVDNVKTDRGEIRLNCMDWIGLAHDRDKWWALVKAVINFRAP
jgi:hypothetical protein